MPNQPLTYEQAKSIAELLLLADELLERDTTDAVAALGPARDEALESLGFNTVHRGALHTDRIFCWDEDMTFAAWATCELASSGHAGTCDYASQTYTTTDQSQIPAIKLAAIRAVADHVALTQIGCR